jgi:hypothetical protein
MKAICWIFPVVHPEPVLANDRAFQKKLAPKTTAIFAHLQRLADSFGTDGGDALRKTGPFFECFPYVCPEPVLVK